MFFSSIFELELIWKSSNTFLRSNIPYTSLINPSFLNKSKLNSLIDELENVRLSLGDPEKKLLSEEKLARFKMGKKIVVNKDLVKGSIINLDDLSFKSPGDGIPPNELEKVLGKKLTKNYKLDEALQLEDID